MAESTRKTAPGPLLELLLAAIVALGLTLLLYGAGLFIPFYSDDLLQIPWVRQTPVAEMWHSLNPFDHYRPLQFSPWRLWYLLAGTLQPAVLRGANLAFHALGGLLVGRLAARLWPARPFPPLLALATFILFPFAFDSVLWVSSFAYPLATATALGALHSYLRARAQGSTGWHLVALLLTTLSGFALESAVLAGPTILLAEFLLHRRLRLPAGAGRRWAWLHLPAAALPFFLIWSFSTLPPTALLPARFLRNGAMLLQMSIFPLAPLLTPLLPSPNAAAPVVALAGGSFTLLAGYLAYRRGWLPLYLFSLAWIWGWNVVPAVTQNYNWLRDPPRAFYPAAVGVALLWTALFAGGRAAGTGRLRLARALLLALLLLPAAAFVRERSALYARAGDLLAEVIALEDATAPVLFVNLPERMTLGRQRYPLGYEGVIPMPPPTDDVDLLRRAHRRPPLAATARAAGQILPELAYMVAPAGPPLASTELQAANAVFVATYHEAGSRLLAVQTEPPAPASATPLATFGQRIRLLAATCVPVTDGGLLLQLAWQKQAETGPADTPFVHLWQGGAVVGQADGAPAAGLYPFAAWPAGTTLTEQRFLHAPAPGVPAQIGLGLYDGQSGTRFAAQGPDGARLAEDTYTIPCR